MLFRIAALQWMRRGRPLPSLRTSLPIPSVDASPRCQQVGRGLRSCDFDARPDSMHRPHVIRAGQEGTP